MDFECSLGDVFDGYNGIGFKNVYNGGDPYIQAKVVTGDGPTTVNMGETPDDQLEFRAFSDPEAGKTTFKIYQYDKWEDLITAEIEATPAFENKQLMEATATRQESGESDVIMSEWQTIKYYVDTS